MVTKTHQLTELAHIRHGLRTHNRNHRTLVCRTGSASTVPFSAPRDPVEHIVVSGTYWFDHAAARLRVVSTTPTSRRGRPPLHRRETLLAAAARAMSARGFESLRYSDVSDGAGVPVASLQHYFPNLEQLRREALSHGIRNALDSAAAAVAAQRRPWGQVRALIAGTSDSATMWVEYLRAAARDSSLAEESREVLASWVALAERVIDEGMSAGDFSVSGSAKEAARDLQALVVGFGSAAGDAVSQSERAARRLLSVTGGAARASAGALADVLDVAPAAEEAPAKPAARARSTRPATRRPPRKTAAAGADGPAPSTTSRGRKAATPTAPAESAPADVAASTPAKVAKPAAAAKSGKDTKPVKDTKPAKDAKAPKASDKPAKAKGKADKGAGRRKK